MAALMSLFAVLLLSFSAAPAPQAPATAPAAQAAAQRPPDLEGPVDEVVAWLRNLRDKMRVVYDETAPK